MKLKLKHIAPYLPYNLMCQTKDRGNVVVSELNAAYSDNSYTFMNIVESEKGFDEIKPILRPLSDLTNNEFDESVIGNQIVGSYKTKGILKTYYHKSVLENYEIMKWLFENHFDVFGLIEKGLAININDLNNDTQNS